MLEELTFRNNEGDTFTSTENGIYAQYNDLHDYLWDYSVSDANKIIQFTRGVVTKTLPLVILCGSEEEGIRIRNQLMEIADKDILVKSPGRFTINDYYMDGYIIGSSKSMYLYTKKYMEVNLTILTDTPVWIKESTVSYLPESRGGGGGARKRYPHETGHTYPGTEIARPYIKHEYPFEYKREDDYKLIYGERDYPWEYYYYDYGRQTINNEFFRACNFEMTIWGYVVDPIILIGDHVYTVETTILEGERVVINSLKQTVVKIDSHGNETDIFNSRGKEYSVFEPIPTGISIVSWSGEWGFDITMFDERSEPIWSL